MTETTTYPVRMASADGRVTLVRLSDTTFEVVRDDGLGTTTIPHTVASATEGNALWLYWCCK